MPENETLPTDSRRASRWAPIKARIDAGEDPTACIPNLETEFVEAIRQIRRDLKANGVSFSELIEAAMRGANAMVSFAKAIKYRPFATLLKRTLAGTSPSTPEQVVRLLLEALWSNARDCLQIDRRDDRIRIEVNNAMKNLIGRMADKLGKNPASRLRRKAGRNTHPSIDDILGESLQRA